MSVHTISFFSRALVKQAQMTVLWPDSAEPVATFYLLHGLSDDHTVWMRQTRIERYVAGLPLAVVMPDGYRGYYRPNVNGQDHERLILEDVVGTVERTFRVRAEREARCIGGLSMGGYGALRLALRRPDMFVSANSHSGALRRVRPVPGFVEQDEIERVFGPDGTPHDLPELARALKKPGTPRPKLLIDCGLNDRLIEANREFHALLESLKIAHTYREHPGDHNWDYWDLHVREALVFHCRALKIKPTPFLASHAL